MCVSVALNILIATLPDQSSSRNCRHRPLATIVPARPPPTMSMFFAIVSSPSVTSVVEASLCRHRQTSNVLFCFAHHDAPVALLLGDAHRLVANLVDPLRDVLNRSFVARPYLHLVAHFDELEHRNQLHQRTGAECAARIDLLLHAHWLLAYKVTNWPLSASDKNLVRPSAPSNRSSCKCSISQP